MPAKSCSKKGTATHSEAIATAGTAAEIACNKLTKDRSTDHIQDYFVPKLFACSSLSLSSVENSLDRKNLRGIKDKRAQAVANLKLHAPPATSGTRKCFLSCCCSLMSPAQE